MENQAMPQRNPIESCWEDKKTQQQDDDKTFFFLAQLLQKMSKNRTVCVYKLNNVYDGIAQVSESRGQSRN